MKTLGERPCEESATAVRPACLRTRVRRERVDAPFGFFEHEIWPFKIRLNPNVPETRSSDVHMPVTLHGSSHKLFSGEFGYIQAYSCVTSFKTSESESGSLATLFELEVPSLACASMRSRIELETPLPGPGGRSVYLCVALAVVT